MISRRVIQEFLDRKLERWDWIKDAPAKEIDQGLRDHHPEFYGIRLESGIKLRFVQKACVLLCLTLKRFMLFLDMGAGKTLIMLMVFAVRKKQDPTFKAVVFVPFLTAIDTWVDETEMHLPYLKTVPLLGSLKENRAALEEGDGDIFVMTYQTGIGILGRKGKGQWKFSAAETRQVFKKYDMLVCDEIHKVRSATSLPFYMLRAISNKVSLAFGLSGTPFGKNVMPLWIQFFLIDLGTTLGETLGLYRETFFSEKPGYFGGYTYKFRQKLMPALQRMVMHRSIRYRIDEIAEMPDFVQLEPIRVKPTEGIAGYYNKLVDEWKKFARGSKGANYEEQKSTYHRMRMLSSGFMTLHGEDDLKAQIELPNNPKVDALMDFIDGIPEDCKFVIFHSYRYTNSILSKAMKKAKIGHARVMGGMGKEALAEVKRFKKDPECRALIINDKAGSSSLNLQIANYVIWFEQPIDPTDKQQGNRRCWRPGQEKTVIFVDFLMRGTIDSKMLDDNIGGEQLLKTVLDVDKLEV